MGKGVVLISGSRESAGSSSSSPKSSECDEGAQLDKKAKRISDNEPKVFALSGLTMEHTRVMKGYEFILVFIARLPAATKKKVACHVA